MHHDGFDYKTNFYKEIKRQMNILSNRANASARHEIDSKLKTMRMRITENLTGGELPHSIFSVKHAIYIGITLNYWRKYSQSLPHTVGNHFPLHQSQNKLYS